jgi:predicted amidohydrolase
MKFNVYAFKVVDIQWIVGIKNDPVDPYATYFKLYTYLRAILNIEQGRRIMKERKVFPFDVRRSLSDILFT